MTSLCMILLLVREARPLMSGADVADGVRLRIHGPDLRLPLRAITRPSSRAPGHASHLRVLLNIVNLKETPYKASCLPANSGAVSPLSGRRVYGDRRYLYELRTTFKLQVMFAEPFFLGEMEAQVVALLRAIH